MAILLQIAKNIDSSIAVIKRNKGNKIQVTDVKSKFEYKQRVHFEDDEFVYIRTNGRYWKDFLNSMNNGVWVILSMYQNPIPAELLASYEIANQFDTEAPIASEEIVTETVTEETNVNQTEIKEETIMNNFNVNQDRVKTISNESLDELLKAYFAERKYVIISQLVKAAENGVDYLDTQDARIREFKEGTIVFLREQGYMLTEEQLNAVDLVATDAILGFFRTFEKEQQMKAKKEDDLFSRKRKSFDEFKAERAQAEKEVEEEKSSLGDKAVTALKWGAGIATVAGLAYVGYKLFYGDMEEIADSLPTGE